MTAGATRAKDIFSTHDAAKICRVTPMTVIRWIKEGKIPAFKTAGGHRRILRSDLVRFCKARGIPFPVETEPEAWRVLLVDADPAVRSFIADAARRVGDKVLVEMAGDAWTAGQALSSFRPNLIFLDAQLPGIDALEVTRRITQQPEGEPPVVAVLVSQPNSDGERAFRSRGAMGTLQRPPTEAAIDRVVRATFQLPELAGPPTTIVHVIDGDPRSSRLVRRDLEERVPGCRVQVFESPVDEILALAGERPKLLVVDLDLPALTPVDLVKAITGHPWDSPVQVVAVSQDESMSAAALAAGAQAFAAKPYSGEALAAQLQPPPRIIAQLRRTRRRHRGE